MFEQYPVAAYDEVENVEGKTKEEVSNNCLPETVLHFSHFYSRSQTEVQLEAHKQIRRPNVLHRTLRHPLQRRSLARKLLPIQVQPRKVLLHQFGHV